MAKKDDGKGAVSAKRSAAGKLAHEERMAMPLSLLAAARESAGLGKAALARAAKMDPTTYSRIERCLVNPFPSQAEAIASALGTSVDDLTGPEAPEPPDGDAGLEDMAASLGGLAGRVRGLEERVGKLQETVTNLAAATDLLAHASKSHVARIGELEAAGGRPQVLDRNGIPIREGCWCVNTAEEVPAKAAPRYVAGVELHEVEGKGLLAYLPDGLGAYGIASVVGGRCPGLAVVDIVERGRSM